MDYVTAFLNVYAYGHCVAEMTVHVRPVYDEAFGNPYRASEVSIEDKAGKRHAAPDATAALLLGRIHDEQPDVWREIEEAAEADFLEGCEPTTMREFR